MFASRVAVARTGLGAREALLPLSVHYALGHLIVRPWAIRYGLPFEELVVFHNDAARTLLLGVSIFSVKWHLPRFTRTKKGPFITCSTGRIHLSQPVDSVPFIASIKRRGPLLEAVIRDAEKCLPMRHALDVSFGQAFWLIHHKAACRLSKVLGHGDRPSRLVQGEGHLCVRKEGRADRKAQGGVSERGAKGARCVYMLTVCIICTYDACVRYVSSMCVRVYAGVIKVSTGVVYHLFFFKREFLFLSLREYLYTIIVLSVLA